MNCTLYDCGGQRWKLPAPVSITLQKDTDAPAAGLKAVFPAKRGTPHAAFLRVEEYGCVWFDGVVDTLQETDGAARLLTVTARSRAALLLDSEALPSLYRTPSLPALVQNHAVPYGFSEVRGSKRLFAVPYVVEKGISEWQALADFCRTYLGGSLREENGILTAEPPVLGEALLLGNGGLPYLQVCRSWNLYRGLSEVWGQSGGYWQKQQTDAAMQQTGILRRRMAASPKSVLSAAQAEVNLITVLCSGWPPVQLGQPAVLHLRGETLQLRVRQILYSLSAKGKTVRLVCCENGEES